MTNTRRPPGLLVLGLIGAGVTFGLALSAIVTFPAAVASASCLALYAVPPRGGMTRKHYKLLALFFACCALATIAWQYAWESSGEDQSAGTLALRG